MKFKSHLLFSRNQRNGIFLLLFIIIFLQALYHFADFSSEENFSAIDSTEIEQFQIYVDSLRQASENKTDTIYPFNPNYITDFKGYTLGMSTAEIDRLLAFRAENKWVNSEKDFQAVTGVSDSLLAVIAPSFKFPEWVIKQQRDKVLENQQGAIVFEDLNSANVTSLQEISGVGTVLANRIVNYRTKIGGFVDELQLKDIYGLNYETRDKITAKFQVLEKPDVNKLSMNNATLLELTEIPYFNYELAREIVDYRLLHEKIESFEELSKLERFPYDKIDRIQLYLTLN